MGQKPAEGKSSSTVSKIRREAPIADAYAIRRLITLMRNPESAEHADKQFCESVRHAIANKEEYAEVVAAIKEYKEQVNKQDLSVLSPWILLLEAVKTKYELYHAAKGGDATEHLIEKMEQKTGGKSTPIRYDFAMSDEKGTPNQGKLVQGFSIQEGENLVPLEEDMEQKVNDLFSEWLTERAMMCTEEGVIVAADKEGNMKVDKQGNARPVDKQDYVKKFTDKENGFSESVHRESKGALKIEVYEQEFPSEQETKTASGSSSNG